MIDASSSLMEEDRRIVSVFIASPSDIRIEREIFHEVIEDVNSTFAHSLGVHIEGFGWEEVLIGAGRPQSKINEDLKKSDLVVFLLWKRWGTPTGDYTSGFEEEFYLVKKLNEKHGSKPELFLYFKEISVEDLKVPDNQLNSVLHFRAKIESDQKIFFCRYNDEKEWRKLFKRHLSDWINGQPFGITSLKEENVKFKQKIDEFEKELSDIKGKQEKTAKLLCDNGKEFENKKQFTQAENCYVQAVSVSHSPKIINSYGLFLSRIGSISKSKEQFEKLLDYANQKNDDHIKAIAFNNLGLILTEMGQYDDSVNYFKLAIQCNEKLNRQGALAGNISNIGFVYQKQGKFEEALGEFNQALSIFTSLGNEKNLLIPNLNVGAIYYNLKNYEKAKEYCLYAIKYGEKFGFTNELGLLIFNLAIQFEKLGRIKDSTNFYKSAKKVFIPLENHVMVAHIYGRMGNLYCDQSNYSEALKFYKKSLRIFLRFKYKKYVALTIMNMGVVFLFSNLFDEARKRFDISELLFREIGDNEGLVLVYRNLIELFTQIDDLDSAEKIQDRLQQLLNESIKKN